MPRRGVDELEDPFHGVERVALVESHSTTPIVGSIRWLCHPGRPLLGVLGAEQKTTDHVPPACPRVLGRAPRGLRTPFLLLRDFPARRGGKLQ